MDSFSEDEFLWTDTSIDTDSTMKSETTNGVKKSKKRKLNEDDDEDEEKLEMTVKQNNKSSIESKVKREGIKSESESEYDVPKKKKKHSDTSEHDTTYDQSYLDMKVKLEDSQDKKKSKKHKQDTKDFKMEITEQESKLEIKTKKKNKKKKSKTRDQNSTLISHAKSESETVEEFNTHEEIDISNNKEENDTVWFSDDNNQDEISAIKGDDDDHILNTIIPDSEMYEKSTGGDRNSRSNLTISETPVMSQVNGSRQPRLSERIRFEDDDEDAATDMHHVSENDNLKQSSKIKRFMKQNDRLRLITPNNRGGEFFSQHDEIWILKCPKDIDVNDFKGKTVNLNSKSKIKVGGHSYDSTTEDDQSATVAVMNLLQNKYQIQNFSVVGTVQLRRRIPKPHIFKDNIMKNNQTNFIPLPETKCRHPLFGANYKKSIKISKAVSERLSACANESSTNSTRKKSKHGSNKTFDSKELTEMKSEQEVLVKKSKKRKLTSKDSLDRSSSPVPRKAKRIKHDPDSSEVWASEKAIEENLFNF